MLIKLKALAVALTAVLAIGAFGAATASAEKFFFNAEAEETTLAGTQEEAHTFTTTAGTLQCKGASFSGSMVETELTTVELTPSYSECTMAGGTSGTATFALNGCTYRLNNGTIEGEKHEGTVGIVCPAEKQIVVQVKLFGATVCTIDVPAQSGLGTVTYSTVGENTEAEITVNLNVKEKLSYSHTGMCGNGSSSTGSATGKFLVKGEGEEQQEGVSTDSPTNMNLQPGQLDFKGQAAGTVRTATFTNTGLLAIYIGAFKVEPNEASFQVLNTGSCEQGGGFVGRNGFCTIDVEFITGVPVGLQQLPVKFGTYWFNQTHQRKVDIISKP